MSRAQYEPTPQAPPPWPAQVPAQGRSPSRVLPILGAVLGTLGLIVGVAAWFRAAPPNVVEGPVYSEQQVADAKTAVCDAYAKGMRTVRSVASRKAENEADKLLVIAVSATGELAAATYFFNILNSTPAAPSNIQQSLNRLAQQYQEVALIQLANGAPSEYESNGKAIDAAIAELDISCQ